MDARSASRDLTPLHLAAMHHRTEQLEALLEHGADPNLVDDQVRGLCEMLGFDPLFLANEGKVLLAVRAGEENRVLEILRSDPLGKYSEVIGEIITDKKELVVLNTSVGGKRIIDMPAGMQLPRIC